MVIIISLMVCVFAVTEALDQVDSDVSPAITQMLLVLQVDIFLQKNKEMFQSCQFD